MEKPEENCIVCGRIPEEKEEFIETEDGFICPDCAGEFDESNINNCNNPLECNLQEDFQENPLDY